MRRASLKLSSLIPTLALSKSGFGSRRRSLLSAGFGQLPAVAIQLYLTTCYDTAVWDLLQELTINFVTVTNQAYPVMADI